MLPFLAHSWPLRRVLDTGDLINYFRKEVKTMILTWTRQIWAILVLTTLTGDLGTQAPVASGSQGTISSFARS